MSCGVVRGLRGISQPHVEICHDIFSNRVGENTAITRKPRNDPRLVEAIVFDGHWEEL